MDQVVKARLDELSAAYLQLAEISRQKANGKRSTREKGALIGAAQAYTNAHELLAMCKASFISADSSGEAVRSDGPSLSHRAKGARDSLPVQNLRPASRS